MYQISVSKSEEFFPTKFFRKSCVIKIFFTLVASLAACNKYYNDMVSLSNFGYYNSFEDSIEYVRQLDLLVNKYLQVLKKIDNDMSVELREASNYDLKSVSDGTNKTGADVINKMHARQIILDLMMYQVQYAYQMYLSACNKYRGETVNALFEDLTFSHPINRMVIYEWVRQMDINVRRIASFDDTISDIWKDVREEINTNPVQDVDLPKTSEDAKPAEATPEQKPEQKPEATPAEPATQAPAA
ncbi:hypothetical protein TpMuguga_01g01145 [Theileria parva strain Muguga]|uniref:Uncharacterized protein n=1 Tax=Theileria parva TaxID=5875 RepID=Q4N6M5_THEPA|nr:uncharacterized protein TpMuguga_01g01145 [Theileria parva strain Muguga]EAN34383.1 hypothetical protein TpMuguga_01g01145 [Theileria parva strain Muguga]|eukprot:XP_766666.1 hypothetical protein [Theileria parva strain Muguga]